MASPPRSRRCPLPASGLAIARLAVRRLFDRPLIGFRRASMGFVRLRGNGQQAGRFIFARAPDTLRTVLKCCDLLRFVAFCPGPARRSAPARKRKGQQRSAKVSMSGDGRFDPSRCPRAAAPVTGAGRMFHICSRRSGFKGPLRISLAHETVSSREYPPSSN